MELVCAANVLQFVFIAIKLDAYIQWKWLVSSR